jgi:hypothetical protein
MNHNENPTPDPLDALLREPEDYIADNGFTARVVAALPRRRNKSWVRPAILCLATGIGAAIAVAVIPNPAEALRAAYGGARSLDFKPLLPLLPMLAALGPVLWSAFEIAREEA